MLIKSITAIILAVLVANMRVVSLVMVLLKSRNVTIMEKYQVPTREESMVILFKEKRQLTIATIREASLLTAQFQALLQLDLQPVASQASCLGVIA